MDEELGFQTHRHIHGGGEGGEGGVQALFSKLNHNHSTTRQPKHTDTHTHTNGQFLMQRGGEGGRGGGGGDGGYGMQHLQRLNYEQKEKKARKRWGAQVVKPVFGGRQRKKI